MKLWISLSILAILALTMLYLTDENHSLSKSTPVAQHVATQTIPTPPVSNLMRPEPARRFAPKLQERSAPAPIAREEQEAPVDNKPDLLTWKAEPPTEYVHQTSERVEDRTECPVMMVTYGDNVKVEQRKAGGRNFDSVGCPTGSSNFLVSTEER